MVLPESKIEFLLVHQRISLRLLSAPLNMLLEACFPHEVFSVYDESRGIDNGNLMKTANEGKYIVITNDKDFGELIFRMNKPHKGIVLLRLEDERPKNKIAVLEKLLDLYSDKLKDNFVVVTEKNVRIIASHGD